MFDAVKRFLKNWQYEIGIFAVLMVGFLNNLEPIGRWASNSQFLFSYQEFGFVRRAFIGSIIHFLSSLVGGGGEVFISKAFVWYFLVLSWLLCFVFIAFSCGRFIRASQEKNFLFAVGMVIVYLASPFSIASLFQEYFYLSPDYSRDINNLNNLVYHHAGGLVQIDFYILIFLLLIVWILALKKEIKMQIFLIPLLCFCITAIHSIAIFHYYPMITILLIYNIYKRNFSKQSVVLFIVSLILMLFLSVYFSFFAKPNFEYQTMTDIIARFPNTDIFIGKDFDGFVYSEYFNVNLKERISGDYFGKDSYIVLMRMSLGLFLTIPLIVAWICFWKEIIKCEKDKVLKLIFIASPLCVLTSFMGIFLSDLGRGVNYIFTTQIIFICFYFYKAEGSLISVASNAVTWARKHIFIVSILIVYILTFGKTTFGLTFPMFFYMKEIVLNLIS